MRQKHDEWWKRKLIGRITWNQVILAVILIWVVLIYANTNWNWVFGLR